MNASETPADPAARAAQYVERRLKPQFQWYERKAATYKNRRHWLASTQIVATVAIPVVNVFTHSVILSSVLAGIAALASGFEGLFGNQELWITYRQTAQALETLMLRYDLRLQPFDGPDRHDRVVEDGEQILEGEVGKWMEGVKQRRAGPSNIVIS